MTEAVAEAAVQAAEEPLSRRQKLAVARAAKAFASYGETRKVMASIAKAIVSLRLTFEKDGRPDYRGETPQYRGAIAALYEAAIPEPDERDSFKVAIRYWVGKEFMARVDAGDLDHAALVEAGVARAALAPAPTPPGEQEPRRAATPATATKTGVIVDGQDLTPQEVLVEAERVVSEHVADESLGVIMAMQSVGRALGPVVAALRNDAIRDKLPGRALKQSVVQTMTLALDAAALVGIDIDELVAQWYAVHEEAIRSNAAVA